ncbi:hypothetical protein [Nonomuraea sp. SBT364]|uniref:hypothetical protein n=1 Tax=Nonomuraea sp. SBT364 TaxID=1580530 RepID=UPI00066C6F1C|nr:hypothetical protein [Nonomuraea sp. SBT364]
MMITLLAVALALTPVQIPKNFLLTEKAARTPLSEIEKSEVWWRISDKATAPLTLNPCGRKRVSPANRSAVRTILHNTSAPSYSSEQLVIHRSGTAARTALRGLLADARRCRVKPDGKPYSWSDDGKTRWVVAPARIGDEAALMHLMMYDKLNKEWAHLLSGIVVRKGRALILYSGDQESFGYPQKRTVKALRKSAAEMAAKVCALPKVC